MREAARRGSLVARRRDDGGRAPPWGAAAERLAAYQRGTEGLASTGSGERRLLARGEATAEGLGVRRRGGRIRMPVWRRSSEAGAAGQRRPRARDRRRPCESGAAAAPSGSTSTASLPPAGPRGRQHRRARNGDLGVKPLIDKLERREAKEAAAADEGCWSREGAAPHAGPAPSTRARGCRPAAARVPSGSILRRAHFPSTCSSTATPSSPFAAQLVPVDD
ncbi:unnamed protein product [Urochloa humidicola]